MVRLHLESRGQRYTERDLDADADARAEILALGASGSPVTVIDGEAVIGFDEEAIDELLGFEPYNEREPRS
jgi:glutaredoxin